MIWAILVLVGVPLWLCALGIAVLLLRSRSLHHRVGNIPVRVLRPGHTRWTRGNGVWVSEVFAWRGSPAAWSEDLIPVRAVQVRAATAAERKQLHRLDADPAVAVLTSDDGETFTVATTARHQKILQGPFAPEHAA